MKPTAPLRLFLLAAGSSLLAVSSASAGQTWDGGSATDSNWNTADNWDSNTLPNFANAIIFTGTARRTPVNNLTPDATIGGINFNSGTDFNTFSLSGARITLGGNVTGVGFAGGGQQNVLNTDTIGLALILNGNRSFTTGQRRTFNFSGVISETGGARNLSTSGSIQLSAANTFSGTTTITAGLLHLSNALALQNTVLDTTTSVGGLRPTSGITTLTIGGLIGNKNFQATAASGSIFNQTTMNSGGGHIGGTNAANSYGSITALTLNPGTGASHSYSGVITNGAANMSLTKTGAGTQTLTNTSTYTGATNVNAGKLTISSTGNINTTSGVSIGAGEFNYNASTALSKAVTFSGTGGTLSGSGTITPTVSVTSGNTLAIGNGVGQMNFGGNLTVAGTYLYELTGGGATADLGEVTGNLTLGGILDLVQLGTYTEGNKFTLFAYDGSLSGVFKDSGGINNILDEGIFTDAGGDWRINYDDASAGLNGGTGSLFVTITAIPEPSAALLGGLGLLVLLRRRRA